MNNELKIIEHENQRVLTTQQLAEEYGTESRRISENFNANKERYSIGKHYYCLEGGELKEFKNEYGNSVVADNINKLYLWTEKGALLHAKSLNTDKAWEVYDYLVETYFKVRDLKASLDNLSPQLQLLINLELEQEKLKNEIKVTNEKLEGIKEIVALNPVQWRKDTTVLINKMAFNMGSYNHISAIREEAYKLLDERFRVSLSARLRNKRAALALNGVCKSKIDKVSKVDVIADDKKLIEGFVTIIKEMAIKYGVAA